VQVAAPSAQVTTDMLSLFGKSGDKMAAAFRGGFLDAMKEAKALGYVVEASVINQLDEAGKALDRFALKWKVNLAPAVTGGIGLIEQFHHAVQASILQVETFLKTNVGGMKGKDAFKTALNESNKAVAEYFKALEVPKTGNVKPTVPPKDVVAKARKEGRADNLQLNDFQRRGGSVDVPAAPTGLQVISNRQLGEAQKQTVILKQINDQTKLQTEASKSISDAFKQFGITVQY
jgi:hypothetical protein